MISICAGDITVQFDRNGSRTFKKTGLIDWVGKPVMALFDSFKFNFDLEGRIQRIDGFPSPQSWDWLQRTMANDWIYYDRVWVPGAQSVPGALSVPAELIGDSAWAVNGRADLPALHGHDGLQRPYVRAAFDAFDRLIHAFRNLLVRMPELRYESGEAVPDEDARRCWEFLGKAARNDRRQLQKTADRLHEIHGQMMVLPPDAIRVDYRVILVKVMDGCINACGFCSVRGKAEFAVRSREDIDRQIEALADIYGADLYNYNSVVFGECDALAAPEIEYAAQRAFEGFHCGESYHTGSNLLLFSTNQSFLDQPDSAFEMLEALPFERIYINVGWEAATDEALSRLGKQQTAAEVFSGMEKAGTINRNSHKIKISGNFILAAGFECESIVNAIQNTRYCGQLYLSPLQGKSGREQTLNDFYAIRNTVGADVRVHLYTMQRM